MRKDYSQGFGGGPRSPQIEAGMKFAAHEQRWWILLRIVVAIWSEIWYNIGHETDQVCQDAWRWE